MRRALLIAMALTSLAILVFAYALNQHRYSDATRRSQAVAEMADAWNGEIQFATSYSALDPAVGGAGEGAAAPGFDPSDEYWGLPRNEGYELVAATCAACHSLQVVMQQRRSAARWDELIDWMVTTQGMPAPAAQDRQTIIAYLSRNYGEDAR